MLGHEIFEVIYLTWMWLIQIMSIFILWTEILILPYQCFSNLLNVEQHQTNKILVNFCKSNKGLKSTGLVTIAQENAYAC